MRPVSRAARERLLAADERSDPDRPLDGVPLRDRAVRGQLPGDGGQPGEQLAYDATAEIQDNWAKITQAGTVANMIPSIADNSANEAAGEPGANPYARFGCSVSTGRRRPVDSSSHKLAKTNERAF